MAPYPKLSCHHRRPGTGPVQKLDRGDIKLPLLPQVASQVMPLAADTTADAAKLSSLIHQDQALAAHVLRSANSPANKSYRIGMLVQSCRKMTRIGPCPFPPKKQKGARRKPLPTKTNEFSNYQ